MLENCGKPKTRTFEESLKHYPQRNIIFDTLVFEAFSIWMRILLLSFV